MGDLGDDVQREIEEQGVPFDILKGSLEGPPVGIYRGGGIYIPSWLFEGHPLFGKEALCGFKDIGTAGTLLLIDSESGFHSAAGAYLGKDAQGQVYRHTINYSSPTGAKLSIPKQLAESLGLTEGCEVMVEAFQPDENAPNGYIVITPRQPEPAE